LTILLLFIISLALFQVTEVEKEERRQDLMDAAGLQDRERQNFATERYCKIPFQQALSLMASRKVYLERGYAYVPLSNLVAIVVTRVCLRKCVDCTILANRNVCAQFRMHLSRALAEATNRFDNIAADTRIGPLLKNLNKQYVGNDFSKASPIDKLTPDKVDAAAENNMPLCMKNLHKNLKTEHKLKHDGRQQYGLFLKGAVSRFLRYPYCITV
jgi:DNA primase large subunit